MNKSFLTLMFLINITVPAHAGNLLSSFNGKVINATSIPSEDIEIKLILRCLKPSLGEYKVCNGWPEAKTILLPVSKTGDYTFPNIASLGSKEVLRTAVYLNIKSGRNLSNPMSNSDSTAAYDYSMGMGHLVSLTNKNADRDEVDYEEAQKLLSNVTLEGFSSANFLDLKIKGSTVGEIVKSSRYAYFNLKVSFFNGNYFQSLSQIHFEFLDGEFVDDGRVEKSPVLAPILVAHAGLPFENYGLEVGVEGHVNPIDPNAPQVRFNVGAELEIEDKIGGKPIPGWPLELK